MSVKTKPLTNELIKADLIFTGVEAATKEEALGLLTDVLIEKGYVEEGYLEDLLERENKFPTGLETSPFAVAIPHATPEHVFKPAIAVMKLKTPIEFNEMVTKSQTLKVRYIFNLVLKKMEYQIELLQRVINIFSDESLMQTLDETEDTEVIAGILSRGF